MRMKKKINREVMLIAVIAITVMAVCSILLFYRIMEKQILEDLKANAHVIARMGVTKLTETMDGELDQEELRVTLIGADGTVLYDSLGDKTRMENHKERKEIADAFRTGEGRAVRKSATSAKQTYYYAMKQPDGDILRVAKESGGILAIILSIAGLIVIIGGGIFVMCAFYSRSLTKRLMAPIEKMAENITLVQEDEVYEEMRPFISTIKRQHMDILNYARIRQEFSANVSHELKTPLTAISGYAELIVSGMAGGEDAVHFASEIQDNAERLQNLINDIIKLSELDGKDLKLEFETVDLYELGENCLSMMSLYAQKNEVSLRLLGEHIQISGNKTLLEELLLNLCSNAVRYNKKGGSVIIKTGFEEGRPMLSVKDTGIGIPKKHQERIFERFYRVDKSRSKSTGGTGLGLAIVKHIAAQHNARITLDSEEGAGTEIKVFF